MASERRSPQPPGALGSLRAPRIIPSAIVEEFQRSRLADSVAAVTVEHGYSGASKARILHHAHMARETFAALFESREDCFEAAYLVLAARLQSELEAAWRLEDDWPARVRAAIAAALTFVAEQPAAARFLAVEIQAAGPAAVAAQAESIDRLVAKLREGRRLYPEAPGINPSTEPAIVGGIVTLIGNRLRDGRVTGLATCEPALVEFALAPYLGGEEACRVARS